MQPAYDSIHASLAPIAGAPASDIPSQIGNYGITGTFSFSPDEIEAIAKEWIELAEDYELSIQRAEGLTVVRPSGFEKASELHAQSASFSGNCYVQSLLEKHEYCLEQAVKVTNSLNTYLGNEQITVDDLKKITTPASKPGGI